MENNRVRIIGTMDSIQFSHEFYEEKFYTFFLASERKSGIEDRIPVIASEKNMSINFHDGCLVEIDGSFRSRNEDGHLILTIFADEIIPTSEQHQNEISLHGFICKHPTYRETPFGRQIADVLVAVNRRTTRSDYIPLIFWGRNALAIADADIGNEIEISGRIQSREYTKMVDGRQETRIAYEVSVTSYNEIP